MQKVSVARVGLDSQRAARIIIVKIYNRRGKGTCLVHPSRDFG